VAVEFESSIVIGAPPEIVFDLALDVDAHVSSQARARETAIAGVTRGVMGLGDEVTWRAVHFGIPFRMTSRVTELDRPRRFVDEQVRGPFRRFHHEHEFVPNATGTTMIDRVRFTAPAGPIGVVVERLALGAYLKRLITGRGEFLKSLAERRT